VEQHRELLVSAVPWPTGLGRGGDHAARFVWGSRRLSSGMGSAGGRGVGKELDPLCRPLGGMVGTAASAVAWGCPQGLRDGFMETSSSSDPSSTSHLRWDKRWDGAPQAWECVGSEQPFALGALLHAAPVHGDGLGTPLGPSVRDNWSCSPV